MGALLTAEWFLGMPYSCVSEQDTHIPVSWNGNEDIFLLQNTKRMLGNAVSISSREICLYFPPLAVDAAILS